jgi:hypothetical protein
VAIFIQNSGIVLGKLESGSFPRDLLLQEFWVIGTFPQNYAKNMDLVGQKLVVFPVQIVGQHPVQKSSGQDEHTESRQSV